MTEEKKMGIDPDPAKKAADPAAAPVDASKAPPATPAVAPDPKAGSEGAKK